MISMHIDVHSQLNALWFAEQGGADAGHRHSLPLDFRIPDLWRILNQRSMTNHTSVWVKDEHCLPVHLDKGTMCP
jgi:hypothetical protein